MNSGFLDSVINNPPLLHYWKGEWNTGGFHPGHSKMIVGHLGSIGNLCEAKMVETGAGQSTALFVGLGFSEVHSICPDSALFIRISKYLDENDINYEGLRVYADRSEEVLPFIAASRTNSVDAALIDGGHGWPTVFVDFCYINKMLKKDAILILDDIQLHSVHELYLWLKEQPQYELIDELNKLTFFRKRTDDSYFPDFGAQPYIRSKGTLSFR